MKRCRSPSTIGRIAARFDFTIAPDTWAAAVAQAPDTSHLSATYANFARVTFMPEELIVDFGLNTQLAPNPNEPVKLTHRIVVNYFTAKRLFQLLGATIQQYEQTYGVLEIDHRFLDGKEEGLDRLDDQAEQVERRAPGNQLRQRQPEQQRA